MSVAVSLFGLNPPPLADSTGSKTQFEGKAKKKPKTFEEGQTVFLLVFSAQNHRSCSGSLSCRLKATRVKLVHLSDDEEGTDDQKEEEPPTAASKAE